MNYNKYYSVIRYTISSLVVFAEDLIYLYSTGEGPAPACILLSHNFLKFKLISNNYLHLLYSLKIKLERSWYSGRNCQRNVRCKTGANWARHRYLILIVGSRSNGWEEIPNWWRVSVGPVTKRGAEESCNVRDWIAGDAAPRVLV